KLLQLLRLQVSGASFLFLLLWNCVFYTQTKFELNSSRKSALRARRYCRRINSETVLLDGTSSLTRCTASRSPAISVVRGTHALSLPRSRGPWRERFPRW